MIAFSGCQDDIVDNPVVPAQTGEEIMFGSELTNIGTRTIYGDNPVDGAYPVYWEDGDQVAIYCPQAAQGKLVNYKITPATDNASHSSAVTKVNTDEAGLQWGTEEVHKFYGFYPASAVTGTEDGKIVGEIPTVQDPVSWKKHLIPMEVQPIQVLPTLTMLLCGLMVLIIKGWWRCCLDIPSMGYHS